MLAITDEVSHVDAISAAMEGVATAAKIGGGAVRFDVDHDGVRIEAFSGFGT